MKLLLNAGFFALFAAPCWAADEAAPKTISVPELGAVPTPLGESAAPGANSAVPFQGAGLDLHGLAPSPAPAARSAAMAFSAQSPVLVDHPVSIAQSMGQAALPSVLLH